MAAGRRRVAAVRSGRRATECSGGAAHGRAGRCGGEWGRGDPAPAARTGSCGPGGAPRPRRAPGCRRRARRRGRRGGVHLDARRGRVGRRRSPGSYAPPHGSTHSRRRDFLSTADQRRGRPGNGRHPAEVHRPRWTAGAGAPTRRRRRCACRRGPLRTCGAQVDAGPAGTAAAPAAGGGCRPPAAVGPAVAAAFARRPPRPGGRRPRTEAAAAPSAAAVARARARRHHPPRGRGGAHVTPPTAPPAAPQGRTTGAGAGQRARGRRGRRRAARQAGTAVAEGAHRPLHRSGGPAAVVAVAALGGGEGGGGGGALLAPPRSATCGGLPPTEGRRRRSAVDGWRRRRGADADDGVGVWGGKPPATCGNIDVFPSLADPVKVMKGAKLCVSHLFSRTKWINQWEVDPQLSYQFWPIQSISRRVINSANLYLSQPFSRIKWIDQWAVVLHPILTSNTSLIIRKTALYGWMFG